jgi:hypothetical protein
MTETAKTIIDEYQVRKTRKQKARFSEYVKGVAEKSGYDFNVEKCAFGAKNLVVGDPENAKVLYTAHYDTAPVLPFPNFITPKNISIYILFNFCVILGIFAVAIVFGFLAGVILGLTFEVLTLPEQTEDLLFDIIFELIYIAGFALMLFGPANKHTVNDNTSGVITLLEIMQALPEEKKANAAFIFFDFEEQGLFGSSGYRSKHKKMTKDKLLINFDCVSDGKNILLVVKKKAKDRVKLLESAFSADENVTVEIATKGVFYPSDQSNFPCGVGVAALKKTKKRGVLYLDRIHTKRDVIFREENIEFLTSSSVKLVEILSNN